MLKIDVDISAAMRKVQAVVKNTENYKKNKFPEKVIKILDENVLPQTPVLSGQLKQNMGGKIEGDTVIYGSFGSRSEGGTNENILWILENSHGGRDAFFVASCVRAVREIKEQVGSDLKAQITGHYP